MAQDPRKRQKALERKAAKDKQRKAVIKKQQSLTSSSSAIMRAQIREAGGWPLHEALISADWDDPMTLTQILVARRSFTGEVATGTYLVDQACLGVKSAFASHFGSEREYRTRLRDNVTDRMPMIRGDLDLAAKILSEAEHYARKLGIEPDPDYSLAKLILGDANPDACSVTVPLGKDGKPFFISGPNDDVATIMTRLTRKLGPDGFGALVSISPDAEFFRAGDDEEFELDFEELPRLGSGE